MTMIPDKCICPGAICNCGALGVVKDGYGVRTPLMMKDSAAGAGGKPMTITDRAASPKYDGVRGSTVGGRPAAEYFAIIDAADEVGREAIGESYASYEFYKRRVSDAYKSPAERQASEERAGAAVQDSGQAAYEQRVRDAWRA